MGQRPEAEDQVGTYDTKTPTKLDPRGRIQVTPTPIGPTVPGETRIEVASTPTASEGPPATAVDRERIPRRYRHHAKEYLDTLIGKPSENE